MIWQEAGVVVLVAGAIYYLVRRMVPGRPRRAKASFVPLASVKRRPRDGGCH